MSLAEFYQTVNRISHNFLSFGIPAIKQARHTMYTGPISSYFFDNYNDPAASNRLGILFAEYLAGSHALKYLHQFLVGA